MVRKKPTDQSGGIDQAVPLGIAPYETKLWSAMHAGPAPLANRMGMNQLPDGGGVRLSFAEEFGPDEPIQWRAGVTLSDYHAYQLFTLLADTSAVQRWKEWTAQQNAQTTVPDEDLGPQE